MQVALVTEPQHESLVDLLCQLHGRYDAGASLPRDLVRSYLEDDLLGAGSPLLLAVASNDAGRVVGLAAVSPTLSGVLPAGRVGAVRAGDAARGRVWTAGDGWPRHARPRPVRHVTSGPASITWVLQAAREGSAA